jgi:hypothetical protein
MYTTSESYRKHLGRVHLELKSSHHSLISEGEVDQPACMEARMEIDEDELEHLECKNLLKSSEINLEEFGKLLRNNIALLALEIREGLVVPKATYAAIMKSVMEVFGLHHETLCSILRRQISNLNISSSLFLTHSLVFCIYWSLCFNIIGIISILQLFYLQIFKNKYLSCHMRGYIK